MRDRSGVSPEERADFAGSAGPRLRRFFVREDPVYRHYECAYQAKSISATIVYLFLYLLPGLIVYTAINVEPVFRAQIARFHLSASTLQCFWVLLILCGWHMGVPLLLLRYADKLTIPESCEFVGLNRVDWRGLFWVLPVFCAAFALVSLPYIKFISTPLSSWLQSVPVLRMPSYSIFGDVEALYAAYLPLRSFSRLSGTTLAKSYIFTVT
jgi:hypothetical protein